MSRASNTEDRRAEIVHARLVTRISEILHEGVAANVFDSDVDAAAAAIIATIQGYFALAATARALIPPGSAASATTKMVEGLVGAKLGDVATRDRSQP
jgi:hypothetical protein